MSKSPAPAKAKSAQKREKIRMAAYRCFRDKGYYQTTVDAICRKARISKGSFYWHFSSKQEVFTDVLDSWSNQVTEELYEQFQDAVRQNDPFIAIATALAREAQRGRSIVPLWVEWTAHARRDDEIQAALGTFFGRIRAAISRMLEPNFDGALGAQHLESLSATILGAYCGLMIQELCDPRGANADKNIDYFMSVLRFGLRGEVLSDGPEVSSEPKLRSA